MAEIKKLYTSEFKKNAVLLSYERNNVQCTAIELDISPKLLSKWRSVYVKYREGSFPGQGKKRVYYEDQKIFTLEKKLAASKLRLEILEEGIRYKSQGKNSIYNFIHQNKDKYPIGIMCQIMGVSTSMYNLRIQQPLSAREIQAELLKNAISSVFFEFKQYRGCVLIARELNNRGIQISEDQVTFFMKRLGLQRRIKKKYKVTTDSKHTLYISPNVLNRQFTAVRPSQIWVSDITYLQIERRFLYLTVIIDIYDRKIVGWHLSSSLSANATILPAWNMAANGRGIEKGLLFHSDRGTQYANKSFTKILKESGCIQSMSRKGNSMDNAVAESFFNSLKRELIKKQPRLLTPKEMRSEIYEYIENWYNKKRRHSALDYMTIEEFNEEN
ncbi:MAG: IS3 family transposase [Flavobacterium nitrogenifigens]|uniref:IS3 family transposase n=1 Tax=Flavobacterium nitrogenifigens TaxID=1617283 RepID=UPI002808DC88|nr:IS3 family transposase [Flavobacterium nitrogenifigens]MDQ8014303.1 IS3 family transposase [Flavobacterium nitrogenifigens]